MTSIKNYRVLLQEAYLAEDDHLSMADKPADAQELKIGEMTGWIAKNEDGYQVVVFKSTDDAELYIEETVADEDELKDTVSAICAKLKDATTGEEENPVKLPAAPDKDCDPEKEDCDKEEDEDHLHEDDCDEEKLDEDDDEDVDDFADEDED